MGNKELLYAAGVTGIGLTGYTLLSYFLAARQTDQYKAIYKRGKSEATLPEFDRKISVFVHNLSVFRNDVILQKPTERFTDQIGNATVNLMAREGADFVCEAAGSYISAQTGVDVSWVNAGLKASWKREISGFYALFIHRICNLQKNRMQNAINPLTTSLRLALASSDADTTGDRINSTELIQKIRSHIYPHLNIPFTKSLSPLQEGPIGCCVNLFYNIKAQRAYYKGVESGNASANALDDSALLAAYTNCLPENEKTLFNEYTVEHIKARLNMSDLTSRRYTSQLQTPVKYAANTFQAISNLRRAASRTASNTAQAVLNYFSRR